jgi:hypothetical protein
LTPENFFVPFWLKKFLPYLTMSETLVSYLAFCHVFHPRSITSRVKRRLCPYGPHHSSPSSPRPPSPSSVGLPPGGRALPVVKPPWEAAPTAGDGAPPAVRIPHRAVASSRGLGDGHFYKIYSLGPILLIQNAILNFFFNISKDPREGTGSLEMQVSHVIASPKQNVDD